MAEAVAYNPTVDFSDAIGQSIRLGSVEKLNALIALSVKAKDRYMQTGYVAAKGDRPAYYAFRRWPKGNEGGGSKSEIR